MRGALDLLAQAHHVLRQDLAPALEGDARYAVLLTASAVATAEREVAVSRKLAAAEAALPASADDIRLGHHDDDGELYARLLAVAALRAHVADPSGLTEEERKAFLEGPDE